LVLRDGFFRVDDFFDRLGKRKIVQWALAYLAGAFALLQAVDIVGQRFGWPEQAERILIVALAIGFFVALVLAWYHGERGAQRVSGTELTLLAVLLAIGGGILWRVSSTSHVADAPAALSAETGVASLGAASTAVLPFVNMSADKGNDYFSDGLTETLLNHLAQVPQLKVAARTSSFSFKGTNTDVRRIGAELGVASLVEGSVQQAGDTLRITAQLVRAADGAHLWSHNYDRKAADLFAIQDEIAGAVTEALVGELLPKTKEILAKGGTGDLSASDAYMRGLQQMAINTFAGYEQAQALMKQALARDPKYVDAMTGLLETWFDMARTGQITDAEFRARAIPMLDRIEAIDPGNAWLLAFRGELANERGEHALAVQLAQRAVATSPGIARVHNILADIYLSQGDLDASLAEMDKVVALNPLDANAVRYRALRLHMLGRLDAANEATLQSLHLDPQNSSTYWQLGLIAYDRGNLAEAAVLSIKAAKLDPDDPESASAPAIVLDELGETTAADAWLAESYRLKPGNLLSESTAALLRYRRGDRADALARALKLVPRQGEEHHNYWRSAMIVGCLAANDLGRLPEMRAALESAGVLPHELSAAGFAAWLGPVASSDVQLREQLIPLRRCVFTQSDADAPRRAQLHEIITTLEGEDWESRDDRRALAAELSNDRDAMIANALPPKDTSAGNLAVREGIARLLGIADDARVVRHFAEQRVQLAQMRATLPAALAKEGLSMVPSQP
jgi:TolB-like protein/Flp pilus assembly protein TadD